MKKYKYVGNGMGVPGLPHEITEDEAAELGVTELLDEAVKNGNYAEVHVTEDRYAGRKTDETPSPYLTPNPSPKGEGNKKGKGVNNGQ